MCTALCYMGAVRAYEFYQKKKEQYIEKQLNDGDQFTFQKQPVSFADHLPPRVPLPVEYSAPPQDIFLEDQPLSEQDQNKQAQETISSIIDDFRNEEVLQDFNEQLSEFSQGKVKSIYDLSDPNLAQIIKTNPEIQQVVSRHMENPDFGKLITEIFSNPQFQQSVQQLQGNSHAPLPAKQNPWDLISKNIVCYKKRRITWLKF